MNKLYKTLSAGAITLASLVAGCEQPQKKAELVIEQNPQTIDNAVDKPVVKEIVRITKPNGWCPPGPNYSDFDGPLTLPPIKYLSGVVSSKPIHHSLEWQMSEYLFFFHSEGVTYAVGIFYRTHAEREKLETLLQEGNKIQIKTSDVFNKSKFYTIPASDVRKYAEEER